MGKEYLVLQVKYEEGKDVWYFYFDPKPMPWKYQFYHDEQKNDGE
jgi:hypothetical protein